MSDHGHDTHAHGNQLVEGDPNAGAGEFRTIFIVFIALAVLTGVEAWVGTEFESTIALIILAFLKAVLVVNYFMHIYRIWREDGH